MFGARSQTDWLYIAGRIVTIILIGLNVDIDLMQSLKKGNVCIDAKFKDKPEYDDKLEFY